MLGFLFSVSLFFSALLLFSIQPMVAKALLPVYGGTPAVWIVCMLFFQLVLLVSYAYAWLLSIFKKTMVWRLLHILLVGLSITALPLLFRPLRMNGQPEWTILYNLISQLGLPLLVIGASAPLLQFAYSQTTSKRAADPYFLYAASNLGSLISLLIYPWIIERFIGLTYQFHLWSIGYFIYIALLAFVLFAIHYKPLESQRNELPILLPWKSILYWVFLSFVPCSLMLGVTLYITTDVAATPLFWVLPLALYLLSFIVTFTTKPLISMDWISRNVMFFLVFTILGFILGVNRVAVWQFLLFNLASFFILAVMCHGQLFQSRPKPQHLTLFYFCLALGGVIAGIFNGILAPHWFNQVFEYPLAILLSVLVFSKSKNQDGLGITLLVFLLLVLSYFLPIIHWPKGLSTYEIGAIISLAIIAVWQKNTLYLFLSLFILFTFIFLPVLQHKNILLQERNFYGVKQVLAKGNVHALISQSTIHGLQNMDEKRPTGYSSYYGALQPVIKAMQQEVPGLAVTLVGLGAGTIVCQFRNTDHIQAIEIDQQVIDLAKNSGLFTYMRDCHPQIDIIKNDGRLAVEQITDGTQNIIILDAFNSDSVPVHLMTLEAFTLYQKKIDRQGIILVNLSNRYLDLMPVINAAAHSLDLMVFHVLHQGDPGLGQLNSEWALLTANEHLASQLMKGSVWRFFANYRQFLWTDDYSNIVPLLRW